MNENTIQGEIIRPFSPAIGKYKINEKIINLINKHIDEILKDQNKIEELHNGDNLAGEIKYEIKINNEFLNTHLLDILKNYLFFISTNSDSYSKGSISSIHPIFTPIPFGSDLRK